MLMIEKRRWYLPPHKWD